MNDLERIIKLISKAVISIAMWGSCAGVIAYAVYLTKEPLCLWGLLVPGIADFIKTIAEFS